MSRSFSDRLVDSILTDAPMNLMTTDTGQMLGQNVRQTRLLESVDSRLSASSAVHGRVAGVFHSATHALGTSIANLGETVARRSHDICTSIASAANQIVAVQKDVADARMEQAERHHRDLVHEVGAAAERICWAASEAAQRVANAVHFVHKSTVADALEAMLSGKPLTTAQLLVQSNLFSSLSFVQNLNELDALALVTFLEPSADDNHVTRMHQIAIEKLARSRSLPHLATVIFGNQAKLDCSMLVEAVYDISRDWMSNDTGFEARHCCHQIGRLSPNEAGQFCSELKHRCEERIREEAVAALEADRRKVREVGDHYYADFYTAWYRAGRRSDSEEVDGADDLHSELSTIMNHQSEDSRMSAGTLLTAPTAPVSFTVCIVLVISARKAVMCK